ncbi:MAG: hypothetical protein ACOYJ1_09100 [Peptococcales bacterium]|jgi:hypothetical protein
MSNYCSYCGNPLDSEHIITFQLGGEEVTTCENECLIYLYQEYQQKSNFTTWINVR